MPKKRIISLLLCLLMSGIFTLTAGAKNGAPTGSFTHWDNANGTKKVVSMRDVYMPGAVINARSLGLEEGFDKIADIDCDDKGNLYILSSDSRLFAADENYNLIREYKIVDSEGEEVDYTDAKGVFAADNGEIYIADTANKRVLCCDKNGVVFREITQPRSELIPDDFAFLPTKIEKDSKGFIYVISDGAYYGALLFDTAGEFAGFVGANSVKASALTSISYFWDLLTKNDIKRGNAVKTLPFQFLDIYVDNSDFLYTCTGRTTTGLSTGQIKMLSPGGSSILYKQQWDGKKTAAGSFNFGESVTVMRNNQTIVQDFVGIQVDELGYIYALDATFGFIYIYDSSCNLITAFGGGRSSGIQNGVFTQASAIVYSNSRVMVADSLLNTITVFNRTDYGQLALSAQKKTLDADYSGAKAQWQKVLKMDSNSRLALRGLAKAYYSEGDFIKSRVYAERGLDFVTYGQALEKTRGTFVQNNFIWIFPLILIIIAGFAAFIIISAKKRLILIKNEQLRILLNGTIHPFNSFNAIKYKNKGSVTIACVITGFFYTSSVIRETCSNFRFTDFNPETSSSVFLFLRTVGLIILWACANWAVSVLQEGKGRLREIAIITAYSTLPLVIYNLSATVLSHLIISPDSMVITGLSSLAVILTGIMLTIGLMVIHEFSFSKFLISVALTLFAMLLIVFVIFMLGMLISQLWTFIATVCLEVLYR